MEIKDLDQYLSKKEAAQNSHQNANFNQPSFAQKNLSSIIDFTIVFVLRILISTIAGTIWYKFRLEKLLSQVNLADDNAFRVLLSLGIVTDFIIFTLIIIVTGGLYYILFYSSKWGATLGCILCDVKLIRKNSNKGISFLLSAFRYVLFIVPVFAWIFIVDKYLKNQIDLAFILMLILSAIWYDLKLIFRIPGGIPDLLSGTMLISTKIKTSKKSFLQKFKKI